MLTHKSKYANHALKSVNKIYFSVWFGDDKSELPFYVRRIIKWNANVFKKNQIPFVVLYKGKKVGKQLSKMQSHIVKIDISNFMYGNLTSTLSANFVNERETSDAFEVMCYLRFIVASKFFSNYECELTHIDCDFMISDDMMNDVQNLGDYEIASFGDGCTPCVWFKNSVYLQKFCDYFISKPEKCDMVALREFIATTQIKFRKIFLSDNLQMFLKNNAFLSYSIRAKLNKICKLYKIDIPHDKRDKDFLMKLSTYIRFENKRIFFDNEPVPFVHFQGWTRLLARNIFTHLL